MKVYVAGPHTPLDGREETRLENIHRAGAAARRLLKAGHTPFCPHTMTAGWESGCSYEEFMRLGLDWLAVCDALLLLPGWEQSPGSRREYEEAVTLGLLIMYDLDSLVSASAKAMADKSGGEDHV
jgi:hypothetical protein